MNSLKIATCTGLAWLLAGCNPLMTASIDTFKAAVTGPQPLTLTQAQVDAVPFPQIKVTTVSSEGVMALIRQRGDLQFWVASGKQVLLMRDGLVVRTVGLAWTWMAPVGKARRRSSKACIACRTAIAARAGSTWSTAIGWALRSPVA